MLMGTRVGNFQPENAKTRCDECGSDFFVAASEMYALCPECAHVLYGYEPCVHVFNHGHCVKCFWDGSTSLYVEQIKARSRD